ncbi:MAG: hypothetical protein H7326_00955 [Bdellovibrionaceae bacterium]|nr:hypothetical protein [Pseudobdellovibrionaceae bacterium]
MKRWSLLLCLVFVGFGLGASAEESWPEKKSDARGDSEANRHDKQFTVLGQLTGLSTAAIGAQQVHLGYFLSPTSLVQLEIGQGRNEGLFFFSSYRVLRVDSLGIQFKKFVANSFYFKTGLDYQAIDYSYNLYSNDYYGFKGNTLGATFSIGNQWQFENFTLGCDWVGIFLPIASNTTKDVVTANSSYSRSESDSDQKRYLKDSSLQFVRFYLGASF